MEKKRMPVLFVGHGSPLLALADNEITRSMAAVAEEVASRHGRPRAILAISAHWCTRGTFVQSAGAPRQVYDIYGFNDRAVIDFERLPDAAYAVPTPEHLLPLIYALGASEGEPAHIFNNICNLGSMSMTGFVFEPVCDRA